MAARESKRINIILISPSRFTLCKFVMQFVVGPTDETIIKKTIDA